MKAIDDSRLTGVEVLLEQRDVYGFLWLNKLFVGSSGASKYYSCTDCLEPPGHFETTVAHTFDSELC